MHSLVPFSLYLGLLNISMLFVRSSRHLILWPCPWETLLIVKISDSGQSPLCHPATRGFQLCGRHCRLPFSGWNSQPCTFQFLCRAGWLYDPVSAQQVIREFCWNGSRKKFPPRSKKIKIKSTWMPLLFLLAELFGYKCMIHKGGKGNPLQYSCLGNPMDRGA